jgi:endoplasmic reticulum resident protein 44
MNGQRNLMSTIGLVITFCFGLVNGAVVDLNGNNFDSTISGAEFVFVNFYADWCFYSNQLKPIFEEASGKFLDPTKVVFAKVDCDRQSDIASKYGVSKYPTLKIFRFGEQAKREYRGQRSVDALVKFAEQQVVPSFQEFASKPDLDSKLNPKKRNIVGYLAAKDGPIAKTLLKIASNLRDDCQFWLVFGEAARPMNNGVDKVVFRDTSGEEASFTGNLQDFTLTKQWIQDKCVPLVRELTFENAEELTEEGLPFLILFRNPSDDGIYKIFTDEVVRQLSDQRTSVNALVADGQKFAHPLHHLGKSVHDLPILAIDSFRHMYVFPDIKQLTTPGKLRQFVLDLHSGKLHREFHNGPDPTRSPPSPGQPPSNNQPGQGGPPGSEQQQRTDPPESVFQKLKPNENRYTLIRDEF